MSKSEILENVPLLHNFCTVLYLFSCHLAYSYSTARPSQTSCRPGWSASRGARWSSCTSTPTRPCYSETRLYWSRQCSKTICGQSVLVEPGPTGRAGDDCHRQQPAGGAHSPQHTIGDRPRLQQCGRCRKSQVT